MISRKLDCNSWTTVNYLCELLKAYKGLPEQWIQILDSFLKIPHLTCSTSQTSCWKSSTDIDIELQIIIYLYIYIYINIYIYIKADMSERHIYNLYIYISWCSSTLVLKTLNSAVFGIAVSPNVVDGILARWYFVLWSNMLSNAARKLCVFIPSPYFQMRATIISAVSNLSTAYNLVNVNLTNVAWLQWTSFGTWSTLQLQ